MTDCICLLPCFIDNIIEKITHIDVPLYKKVSFYYPLHRHKPIEEGKRIVTFSPPKERLEKDRIHEFIGARHDVPNSNNSKNNSSKDKSSKEDYKKYYEETGHPDYCSGSEHSDLNRIRRQQILVKEFLQSWLHIRFPFDEKKATGVTKTTMNILQKVDASFTCTELKESDYTTIFIQGKYVLQRNNHLR